MLELGRCCTVFVESMLKVRSQCERRTCLLDYSGFDVSQVYPRYNG